MYMLPWQPEFQSNQPKNLMQPFPLPDDAFHEIWSKLANRLWDILLWNVDERCQQMMDAAGCWTIAILRPEFFY